MGKYPFNERRRNKRANKKTQSFTKTLLLELQDKNSKFTKQRKDMTVEEIKALKLEKRRRKNRDKKIEKAISELDNRKPVENTCRRRRLSEKHKNK